MVRLAHPVGNGQPPLNPRRRLHAQAIIDYLVRFGRKMWLPKYGYHCHQMTRLPEYAIDAAVDDLFTLGVVDMRESGDGVVVELLSDDLDGATAATTEAPRPKPTNGKPNGNSHWTEGRFCPDATWRDHSPTQPRTYKRPASRPEPLPPYRREVRIVR